MRNEQSPDEPPGPVHIGYVDESGQPQYLSVGLVDAVRVGLTFADGRTVRFSWHEVLQLNAVFALLLKELVVSAMDAE